MYERGLEVFTHLPSVRLSYIGVKSNHDQHKQASYPILSYIH